MAPVQLTLFGGEVGLKPIRRTKAEAHEDYETFVDKFSTKKTTDDCYTPPAVYDAVLNFVRNIADIENSPIVRPFFPGGDYENFCYPEGCVVIDNPPFSILSSICRFYYTHKVPFFLFAPSLTLFIATDCDLTYIITDAEITYENGAVVHTGFITNMISDVRVWVCPELREAIIAAQPKENKHKKGFVYPDNIITSATLNKIARRRIELKIPKAACEYITSCDSATTQGRALFGGGFILSDKAAAERAAADKAAAERAVADKAAAERAAAERAAAERAAATKLNLSQRERAIIARLNEQYH